MIIVWAVMYAASGCEAAGTRLVWGRVSEDGVASCVSCVCMQAQHCTATVTVVYCG